MRFHVTPPDILERLAFELDASTGIIRRLVAEIERAAYERDVMAERAEGGAEEARAAFMSEEPRDADGPVRHRVNGKPSRTCKVPSREHWR